MTPTALAVRGQRDLHQRDRHGSRVFVFLNEDFVVGGSRMAQALLGPQHFMGHVEKVVAQIMAARPDTHEREQKRAVVAYCRSIGQIPEKTRGAASSWH